MTKLEITKLLERASEEQLHRLLQCIRTTELVE